MRAAHTVAAVTGSGDWLSGVTARACLEGKANQCHGPAHLLHTRATDDLHQPAALPYQDAWPWQHHAAPTSQAAWGPSSSLAAPPRPRLRHQPAAPLPAAAAEVPPAGGPARHSNRAHMRSMQQHHEPRLAVEPPWNGATQPGHVGSKLEVVQQCSAPVPHLQCLHVLEAAAAKAGNGQHHGARIRGQLRQRQVDLQ